MTKVNGFAFAPGDTCLFRAGQAWTAQLTPTVSGAAGNHITFGAWDKGLGPNRVVRLTAGIDGNGRSYLTWRDIHVSGNRIWGDSGENHLHFHYCIIENTGAQGFYGADGIAPTNIEFYNSIFSNCPNPAIKTTGAATVKARNCIFFPAPASDSVPFEIGVGGNLDLDYCLINTWKSDGMPRVSDGGHNLWYAHPKIEKYCTDIVPRFCLTFDDNYVDEFEIMANGIFITHNIKATMFLNTGVLPAGQKVKVAALSAMGHEMANHTWSHGRLTGTVMLTVTSTNTNPTCDVDVPTTTITLWCDEGANRVTYNWVGDKTIGDLIAAVAGKGWTVTETDGDSRHLATKLDCLADSGGPQSCAGAGYAALFDVVAPNYKFWAHEINDAQDELETLTGIRPVTLAYPYGPTNANLIAWLKANTTLKTARQVGGAPTTLASVPIWTFIQRDTGWINTSTEAEVRAWTRRQWLYARNTPAYFLFYEHNTTAAYRERIGWVADELSKFKELDSEGVELITYRSLVEWIEADHEVVGDNWVKSYDVTGAYYHPLTGSPLINAGVDTGFPEDIAGRATPQGGARDIGAYELPMAPPETAPTFENKDLRGCGFFQDLSTVRNRIIIEGIEQGMFATREEKKRIRLTGEASDPSSIEAYLEKTHRIKNHLFQDQASIDTMVAVLLAAWKDPKHYAALDLFANPVPLELGDTIGVKLLLQKVGEIEYYADRSAIIRDISIGGDTATYKVEIKP